MTVEVRRATDSEVRELRLSVLRPAAARVPSAYDLDPATVHIGAFCDGRIVGCASVFPEPFDDEPLAWRLRGMAVDPEYQGRGIGRLVLDAAVAAADAAGAPLIWANGRVSAMAFYQRLGWEARGEVFTYGPADLPHLVIVRPMSAARRTVSEGAFPR
jgi:GNAT superfamily N-acetyltransferase